MANTTTMKRLGMAAGAVTAVVTGVLAGASASAAPETLFADTQSPSAPTGFCVEAGGSPSKTFHWSASTDNVDTAGQIRYELWDPMFYKGVPTVTVVGKTTVGPLNFGSISVISAIDRAGNRSDFVALSGTC